MLEYAFAYPCSGMTSPLEKISAPSLQHIRKNMVYSNSMRKLTPEREAEILNDIKSDLSRSISELAKLHKVTYGTLSKLLKDQSMADLNLIK